MESLDLKSKNIGNFSDINKISNMLVGFVRKDIFMNNEILFYTQLGSIVAYIITVFSLYRLLVYQKEATIELLKEKNNYYETQLKDLKEKTPGILEEILSKRINIRENELKKLSKDEVHNKEIIQEKENELQIEREKLEKLQDKIEEIKEISAEYFCSDCGAPLITKGNYGGSYEEEGMEYEVIEFECGKQIINDRVHKKCSKLKENI
jgi:DNA-directed RNA polymerase subunit RPC12/RpoP